MTLLAIQVTIIVSFPPKTVIFLQQLIARLHRDAQVRPSAAAWPHLVSEFDPGHQRNMTYEVKIADQARIASPDRKRDRLGGLSLCSIWTIQLYLVETTRIMRSRLA